MKVKQLKKILTQCNDEDEVYIEFFRTSYEQKTLTQVTKVPTKQIILLQYIEGAR